MPDSRRLSDDSGRRREVALAGHTGDEATARAGLGDDDPRVRATALGALARLGELRVDELRHASTDDDAGVRRRAAELAPTLDPPVDALAVLRPLLTDIDASVVEMAAWACGEVDDPDAASTVGELSALATGHEDALVREAAVAALGAMGDPAGLPAILAATSDKPAIRRRAVLALAPFEGPEVDAALARAREDRDWQVRQAAEDLLS
jgi:HEAT repeat protein